MPRAFGTGGGLREAGLALAACAPRAAEGQSQAVDGVRFDYGLVAEPAPGAPPAGHPDLAMHGGAPLARHAYHVVLSLAAAGSGQTIEPAEARSPQR